MLKGFKDFILRGNVIELAVAVVIAIAFTDLVKAVTMHLVNPLVAAINPGSEIGWGFYLRAGNDATFMNFGAVITALINFLIVAAVVYFLIVVPLNKLASMRKSGEEPEPESPGEEIMLLQEIRDLLRQRQL